MCMKYKYFYIFLLFFFIFSQSHTHFFIFQKQGDYTELQVGPAPSQMQSFAVPKKSRKQWTEWFKAFQANPADVRGPYPTALSTVDSWMKSAEGMPQTDVLDWDAFFEQQSVTAPAEVLVRGTPWGALEEMRLGHPLAPGLMFTLPPKGTADYEEVQPWIELLQIGTFSEESLGKIPTSYQTTDAWFQLIQKSAEKFGMSWLHALHIGIGMTERGAITEPTSLFTRSLELHPNPVAARCLAVLSSTPEAAWPLFQQAWTISQTTITDATIYKRMTSNLVTEISFFLQQSFGDGSTQEMLSWLPMVKDFVAIVPSSFRGIDAFLSMIIKLGIYEKQFDQVLSTLSKECFPIYAKARSDLMAMWNTAQEGKALQAKGPNAIPLTAVEKHRARVSNPIPDNIGCQYASEYCMNYW